MTNQLLRSIFWERRSLQAFPLEVIPACRRDRLDVGYDDISGCAKAINLACKSPRRCCAYKGHGKVKLHLRSLRLHKMIFLHRGGPVQWRSHRWAPTSATVDLWICRNSKCFGGEVGLAHFATNRCYLINVLYGLDKINAFVSCGLCLYLLSAWPPNTEALSHYPRPRNQSLRS